MLTYLLEDESTPLYRQIYENIKNDIVKGNLTPNSKLPSKRSFARNHSISTITIQNAYDQLISEGYVYSIPKKGYYVSDIGNPGKVKRSINIESHISLDIKLPKAPPLYEIDLSNNTICPDNFPFSTWAKLMRSTMTDNKNGLMTLTPTGGIYELRKGIAEHLKSFRGMLVDPDQVIIGAGTEYLYGLLIQLLGHGQSYCLENPGYKKIADIYRENGVSYTFANVDCDGIVIDDLKKSGADLVHISPNHHFPTGITMPASRRYQVLAWANEAPARYIIEDDYDSEFRSSGRPIPTLFSIDGMEKVIYMNTFSKSLSPTIRISYMILPVHLANLFYEKLSFYSCTVSNFEQYTLSAFIEGGYFEKYINRMRMHYQRQRKKVIEIIESSSLKGLFRIIENDSGLHFLIGLTTNLSDLEISKRLSQRGIGLQALSEYYFDSVSRGATDHRGRQSCHQNFICEFSTELYDKREMRYFILNYSNIDLDKLPKACEIIHECINDK